MKLPLTGIALLLALSAFAQRYGSVEFSMGLGLSIVNFDAPQYAPGYGFPYENVPEKPAVTPAFKLGYAQRIVGPLYLRTGVEMHSVGYRYAKDFTWPDEFLSGKMYKIDHTVFAHRFLAVPLTLRLMPASHRLTPYIDAGLNAGFYLNTREHKTLENTTKHSSEHLDSVNPFQLNAVGALGIQFGVGDRAGIFIQPVLQYSLTDLTDGTASPVFQWGLDLGGRLFLEQ